MFKFKFNYIYIYNIKVKREGHRDGGNNCNEAGGGDNDGVGRSQWRQ